MDLGIVTTIVSTFALIVGAAKAILDLRNAQRAAHDWLPVWLRGSRLWLAIVGASVTALAGLGVLGFLARPEHRLSVAVWSIEADAKGSIVLQQDFAGFGTSVGDDTIAAFGEWLDSAMAARGVAQQPIEATFSIPADPADGISVPEPSAAWDVMVYLQEPTGKLYIPFTQARALLDEPFWLEIRRAGYERQSIPVTPGQPSEVTLVFTPRPVVIGVEEFSGSDVTAAVQAELVRRGYDVRDPVQLERLREAVRASREESIDIGNTPIQMAHRATLEIDYIVSGSVTTRQP